MFIYAYVMLGTTVGIVPPDLWRIKVTLVLKNTIFVEISTGYLSTYIKYMYGYIHLALVGALKARKMIEILFSRPKSPRLTGGHPWLGSGVNPRSIRRTFKNLKKNDVQKSDENICFFVEMQKNDTIFVYDDCVMCHWKYQKSWKTHKKSPGYQL